MLHLSNVLAEHFAKISALHVGVSGGRPLSPSATRATHEEDLRREMMEGLASVRSAVPELGRQRPLRVACGAPKGAWAHVYYVSFHDPINSTSPQQGFYPVFLLSLDHKQLWLVLMLAAASVGVTGRGGWSKQRGRRLASRAALLRSQAADTNGWVTGPIALGPNDAPVREQEGNLLSVARAYEAGVVVGRKFSVASLPTDLAEQLIEVFRLFDEIYAAETTYVDSAVPPMSDGEWVDQLNAAITGQRAEQVAIAWLIGSCVDWGTPVVRTDRVGLGYDIEFPEVGAYVDVKGFTGALGPARMTRREWEVAAAKGDNYYLCIVTGLDLKSGPEVQLLRNPYRTIGRRASEHRRLQITYTVPLQLFAGQTQRAALSDSGTG